MKTLSIRQPWAGCIVGHDKRIENRTRQTKYRGPVLVHAGKECSAEDIDYIETAYGIQCRGDHFRTGGVVGVMEITDCKEMVTADMTNRWAAGPWLWRIGQVASLPYFACNGALGFFDIDYPNIDALPDWAHSLFNGA